MQRVEKCSFLLAETPHLFKPHKRKKERKKERRRRRRRRRRRFMIYYTMYNVANNKAVC
jgi:hypothetical protein